MGRVYANIMGMLSGGVLRMVAVLMCVAGMSVEMKGEESYSLTGAGWNNGTEEEIVFIGVEGNETTEAVEGETIKIRPGRPGRSVTMAIQHTFYSITYSESLIVH